MNEYIKAKAYLDWCYKLSRDYPDLAEDTIALIIRDAEKRFKKAKKASYKK